MKTIRVLFYLSFCFTLVTLRSPAAIYYVNAANLSPTAPFDSWDTAATNIQDAIDLTTNGDTVLVTNGVYAYGGLVMAGDLMDRVALTNAITVESVNGPWVTTILGAGALNGTNAVRCAWLTNGATLAGFTLTAGSTRNTGDTTSLESGGGVWCASSNAFVANCVIVSNTAYEYGGGAYSGTLANCAVYKNNGFYGGGTSYGYLDHCTITANYGTYGGTYGGAFTNCIIYYNSNGNYDLPGPCSYCCTYPLPSSGVGNFTNLPGLFVDLNHLTANSPCIGAGTNLGTVFDINSQPWGNPPSVGCSEFEGAPLLGSPIVYLTNTPLGLVITAPNTGAGSLRYWWLDNGVPVTDGSQFTGSQTASLLVSA